MVTIEDAVQPPTRLQSLASWQVSKISTLATRLTAQRMPLTGRADSAVLAALAESGQLSQADLGRRLGLDRNDVNGVVNRLEAGGHVTRRVDPSDRRRNIVTLTRRGTEYGDELFASAEEVQDELLSGLTGAEREQLAALLGKLLSAHSPQPA